MSIKKNPQNQTQQTYTQGIQQILLFRIIPERLPDRHVTGKIADVGQD